MLAGGTMPDDVARARMLLTEALAALADVEAHAAARRTVELAIAALDGAQVSAEPILALGLALEDERRYEAACDFHQEAVRLAPGSALAWTNLGEARRKLHRWPEAITAYDAALARDPDYVWALAGKAEALRMTGRAATAIPLFERALAIAPDHVFAVLGLAASLSEVGRHREALGVWEHAVKLQPDSGFASDGLIRCRDALARAAVASALHG